MLVASEGAQEPSFTLLVVPCCAPRRLPDPARAPAGLAPRACPTPPASALCRTVSDQGVNVEFGNREEDYSTGEAWQRGRKLVIRPADGPGTVRE